MPLFISKCKGKNKTTKTPNLPVKRIMNFLKSLFRSWTDIGERQTSESHSHLQFHTNEI